MFASTKTLRLGIQGGLLVCNIKVYFVGKYISGHSVHTMKSGILKKRNSACVKGGILKAPPANPRTYIYKHTTGQNYLVIQGWHRPLVKYFLWGCLIEFKLNQPQKKVRFVTFSLSEIFLMKLPIFAGWSQWSMTSSWSYRTTVLWAVWPSTD